MPKDTAKNMLKGFGFINFGSKKEALVAIKETNQKMFMKRKLEVSLAQQKEEYKKTEETKVKEVEVNKVFEKKENVETKKFENKLNKPLLNDPKRTLFIRNLGFQTDEDTLKEFFQKQK